VEKSLRLVHGRQQTVYGENSEFGYDIEITGKWCRIRLSIFLLQRAQA